MTEEISTKNVNYPALIDLANMPSMDELISTESSVTFLEGSVVNGKVIEKRDSGVIVDIGYKAEAFIPKDDFVDWKSVNPGDEIKAILESIENEFYNMPLLSVQKAELQQAWDEFVNDHVEGTLLKGTIRHRVKGGFIVDVGIDAFLPGSQVDVVPIRDLDDLVGKEFDFKLLKINTDRKNIVISRRELIEESKARQRAAIMVDILPGQIRKGVVKNITDFGAFIDLNGVDGLLHITDMSWGRISHPSEMLSINEEIEAVILDVDREKERISLGLKQKVSDPWDTVEERYPVGSRVKGKVVNVMPYGAFIELEVGVEGLIHISEMSWTKRVIRASDILNVDDEVEAIVIEIQRDSKKISLGLRQAMENPWEAAGAKYPTGCKVSGRVRNLTSYGAFIEIEENIDGMVHVSDMSWTRKINNPSEILSRGDEVEAVVLGIDPEQQRISLGIKQLTEDPWENIDQYFTVGKKITGTVRKITNFGGFVRLDHDIDGLIHISQISDERVDKVRDYFKIGETIEPRIIKIDKQERRVGLSLKEPSAVGEQQVTQNMPSNEDYENNLKPGEQMVDVGDIFDSAIEASETDAPADQVDNNKPL